VRIKTDPAFSMPCESVVGYKLLVMVLWYFGNSAQIQYCPKAGDNRDLGYLFEVVWEEGIGVL